MDGLLAKVLTFTRNRGGSGKRTAKIVFFLISGELTDKTKSQNITEMILHNTGPLNRDVAAVSIDFFSFLSMKQLAAHAL